MKRSFFAVFLSGTFLTAFAFGRTIYVDDDGPANFSNIQAAIDDANDGDTVIIKQGTYTGFGNRDIDFLGKAITVSGEDPNDFNVVAATIIDCNGSESEPNRGFYFHSGEGPGSVLCGLTITNGYAEQGGGIYISGSRPNIRKCRIIGNSASIGGGLYAYNTPEYLEVLNCTIQLNRATNLGGGIYAQDSDVSFANCIISCNTASDGGGLSYYKVDGEVLNCTFSDNVAESEGGGVYMGSGYILFVNCIFWGNSDSTGYVLSAQICPYTYNAMYSCVQDEDSNDANIPSGQGNIDDNPMFVREPDDGGDGWGVGGNDDCGDLHLRGDSPCINAGKFFSWNNQPAQDIDGEQRIMGPTVDMGVDEYVYEALMVDKPVGAEVWGSGSRHTIKWSGYFYTPKTAEVLFSSDGGNNWRTIHSGAGENGSFFWSAPDIIDSNRCVIKVVPSQPDPNVVCIGSGEFTIHPVNPDAPVEASWKSRGGDFDRSALSEAAGPQQGCVQWEFETDAPVSAGVTVGPNAFYLPCEDGNLYCLDSQGSVKWTFEANTPLISSASIGPDGAVYVGGMNSKLYAVDKNGGLRWTYTTEGFIYASPAVSEEGIVYVGSQDGKLCALGQDGSKLWSFETDGPGELSGSIMASPAIGTDGSIYVVGLYDPNIYALDSNDGSIEWVCNFDSVGWPFVSPVVAEDGTIYQVLVNDPYLYAVDPNNGDIKWSTHLSDIYSRGPSSDGTYIVESIWFEPYEYESATCMSMHLLKAAEYEHARFNLGDSAWSEPAIGPDGTIYVSLDDGWLRAVNPNGKMKWAKRIEEPEIISPGDQLVERTQELTLSVDKEGLIYATSDNGNLYVISPQSAEVARFDSNDSWPGHPVVCSDNMLLTSDIEDRSLLISSKKNKVWAFGSNDCDGKENKLRWQQGPQDLDDSGEISFADFAVFATQWLRCRDCNWEAPCYNMGEPTKYTPIVGFFDEFEHRYPTADVTKDGYVDYEDLEEIGRVWLEGQ